MSLSDVALSRRHLLRGMTGMALAVGALPLLAACGGDDDEDPAPTVSAAADATATTAPASESTPEAEPTEEPAAEPTAPEVAPYSTATTAAEPTAEPTGGSIVAYIGRSENLVAPLIEMFTAATGIEVEARYANTTELAALILEEGDNSPADIYFAQDGGALGAVAKAGHLLELPADVLDLVDPRFRSAEGMWIGLSGRARAVVYNTDALTEADMPASILDFTDPVWSGRLGWAPTNASFQTFITALRVVQGEDVARGWLDDMIANDIVTFEGNGQILQAVIAGEIDAGFVNHYYLLAERAEVGDDIPAENYIYSNGDAGALVNIAGAGVLASSSQRDVAIEFLSYMLSTEAQEYFATETKEYPLVEGVEGDPGLVPLADIQTPDVDLTDLDDLQGTVALLTEVGLL